MRGAFAGLVRLYLGSVYGIKPFSEYRTAKDWLKFAGMVLLFLLILADFGAIFVASSIAQYEGLAPQGLQGLLLLNAAIMASMLVFVLGFVMALSTWSLSPAEVGLLALPIPPRSFLAAKFIVVYLSELAFSVFLMGINLAVFGLREGAALPFYLCGAIVSLALPLFPLALAYLVIVPLMTAARFMRNKNAILILGGVVGIGFALAFNLYIQASMARLGDPGWVLRNYAGPGTLLNLVGSTWPPSWLAWKSLEAAASGAWPAGLGWTLVLAASGCLGAGLVVLGLGRAYVRSLLDFGEGSFKRLGKRESRLFIDRTFARRGLATALFLRENRLMNREPLYFLNGPFILVLTPLILGVMYVAQRASFAELQPLLEAARHGPAGLLVGAAFGGFLGSSTSIASTSLSRDAKALPWLRALPIPPLAYMGAKLCHGLAYALLGSLVGGLGATLVIGLGIPAAAASVFVGFSFAALMNMAGLWIDTANPRLSWDNPTAALKQNPNGVIAILASMALLAALGALASMLPLDVTGFTLAYGGGSAFLFFILLVAYRPWVKSRLSRLEA